MYVYVNVNSYRASNQQSYYNRNKSFTIESQSYYRNLNLKQVKVTPTTMFQSIKAKTPSHHSRKAFDYLIQQPESQQKYFSSKKMPQTQPKPQLSPYSKQQQTEYELIVQFQLRRQKQKNLILQQRLRNKESFIKQMKEFQDELTVAFEKCQEELHYYKTQCQEYESKWNSFATFNHNNSKIITQNVNETLGLEQPPLVSEQMAREYLQEIAELKHLVIRLQEEINFYQKKEKANHHTKNLSSSVQKEFYPSKKDSRQLRNAQSHQVTEQSPDRKQGKKYKPIQDDRKEQRSKTLANEFVEQKREENFATLSNISEFINQETRKISSFLNHFLTMCEFFEQSIEKQESVKHKLKRAWKWIKSTIVEWNYLKREKLDKVKEFKIGNIVSNLLPLANLSIAEIQVLLEKMLKLPQVSNSGKH